VGACRCAFSVSVLDFGDVASRQSPQGSIGDCWLMSSMSAVAEYDGLIQKLFAEEDINQEGRYVSADWQF
jgi:hypothetical protein